MNQKTLTFILFLCVIAMSLKPYKKEHTTQASTLKQKASLPVESEKLCGVLSEIREDLEALKRSF